MIKEGEKRRSILTGKVYHVKAIKDRFVVLGSLDGSSQVWTEKDNLKLFYEKVENENARGFGSRNLKEITIGIRGIVQALSRLSGGDFVLDGEIVAFDRKGISRFQLLQRRDPAQIAFAEWTKDGRLRQPAYLGLRYDKKPAIREPVEGT